MLFVKRFNKITYRPTRFSDLNADTASVFLTSLMIKKTEIDKFFKIVRNIRAQVATSIANVTRRHFLIAYIVKQQSLNRIYV